MSSSQLRRQIARFAAAGLVNTTIDYVGFLLLIWVLHLPLAQSWIAKALSGSLAMGNSFVLNRSWVFHHTTGGTRAAVRFVVVTMAGTYVVQLGGTYLLSAVWPAPGQLGFSLMSRLGVVDLAPRQLTEALVIRTVAFGFATAASTCWNFCAYRRWVFPDGRDPAAPLSSA